MNIAIYIYDEAEVLDFSGPYEVFSVANRFLEESKKHKLFLVSQNKEVKARGDYKVLSHYTIDNHPKIDVLVVAGGVHTGELKKDEVISWISKIAKNVKFVASVCTGAFLLAKAEVIKEHKVTTHWEDIPDLKKDFPLLKVVEDVRWVDEGDIITSAGISAGIDMSLHLVSKLYSLELAQKVAKQMQFDWTKDS
ncbi:DJ-1/PfpI family protein [Halarcobacter ebronensis]|uniref:Glutamine amidotransferase n=1 Tax=Halarcobacter ebronensis TaxID=1462615 RepID=A0A4Q1APN7_9BACT|nr:DJ-1/PfpI family protein [Halarcobacter ebronensis]QKF81362.1 GATase1_PfpI_2 domain-containing protein [Halarcobacter ebronensis]RXK04923.1 glutamine amidotransferase [Halarcobacter ebronensis]